MSLWMRGLRKDMMVSQVQQYEILRESQYRFLEELQVKRSPSNKGLNPSDGFKFVGSSFHSQKSNLSNKEKKPKSQSKRLKGKAKISLGDKASDIQLMKQGLQSLKAKKKIAQGTSQQLMFDQIVKGLMKKTSRNAKN